MCYVESKAHTSPDGQRGWQETTFPCQIVQSGGRCPSMTSPKIQPPDAWLNPQPYPPPPMERGRTMQKPRNTRPLLRQSDFYPRRGLPERQERVIPYHTSNDEYEISVPRRRGSMVGLNGPDPYPSEWLSRERDAVTLYHLGRRSSVAPPLRRRQSSTSPYPQRFAYGQRAPRPPEYIDPSQSVPIAIVPSRSYQRRRPSSQTRNPPGIYNQPPGGPLYSISPPIAGRTPPRRNAILKDDHFSRISSKRLAEECGWQVGREKFLWKNEPVRSLVAPTARGFLGRGTVGLVEEVKIAGYDRSIARKRIILARNKSSALRDRNDIRAEIENLRRLNHEHIIKILGCYEEPFGQAQSICALMYPSGDEDLSHFLYEECHPVTVPQKRWIKSWFHCLASALAYMHKQKVHHEDIKPSNIIHRGKDIFFTDFSSSRRLDAGQDTSTESPAKATRLFAAPEAMMSEDGKMLRHGSKTDVYSLGLVYVEMIAVLCGKDISEMRDYLFEGPQQSRQYHRVVDKIPEFLGQQYEEAWTHCLKQMLHPTRQSRPSAQGVLAMLDKGLGLKPSKVSCTCRGTQQSSSAGKASRRSTVAVHNPPSTKQDTNLTFEFPGHSEISFVVESGKILITEKGSSSEIREDEATMKGRPARPATPFQKPAGPSGAGDSTNDDQESSHPNEGHSSEELDDDFVWVDNGQVDVRNLEETLKSAQSNDQGMITLKGMTLEDVNGSGDTASNDISLVMQQTSATCEEAVKALEENNNDVIDAIMSFAN